jgi:hypothetical protein
VPLGCLWAKAFEWQQACAHWSRFPVELSLAEACVCRTAATDATFILWCGFKGAVLGLLALYCASAQILDSKRPWTPQLDPSYDGVSMRNGIHLSTASTCAVGWRLQVWEEAAAFAVPSIHEHWRWPLACVNVRVCVWGGGGGAVPGEHGRPLRAACPRSRDGGAPRAAPVLPRRGPGHVSLPGHEARHHQVRQRQHAPRVTPFGVHHVAYRKQQRTQAWLRNLFVRGLA